MKHFANRRFWQCYEELPDEIKQLANKNYELLKKNPFHPSLHFKKAGRLQSVRIGIGYRAVAVPDGPNFVWFWIGPHGQYDLLIGSRR